MDSNPFSTDSNHLRQNANIIENKEMDSNPSSTDSNHLVSFATRSHEEHYGFESPQFGFESSVGNQTFLSKGFESFINRFKSPRPKIENDRFPMASF